MIAQQAEAKQLEEQQKAEAAKQAALAAQQIEQSRKAQPEAQAASSSALQPEQEPGQSPTDRRLEQQQQPAPEAQATRAQQSSSSQCRATAEALSHEQHAQQQWASVEVSFVMQLQFAQVVQMMLCCLSVFPQPISC